MYKRIKELRIENGFTKVQLAQQLSISFRSYSNLEEGKTQLRTVMVVKLAEFYNTSIDYILGLTEIKERQ